VKGEVESSDRYTTCVFTCSTTRRSSASRAVRKRRSADAGGDDGGAVAVPADAMAVISMRLGLAAGTWDLLLGRKLEEWPLWNSNVSVARRRGDQLESGEVTVTNSSVTGFGFQQGHTDEIFSLAVANETWTVDS
jgi:hypothetical protein